MTPKETSKSRVCPHGFRQIPHVDFDPDAIEAPTLAIEHDMFVLQIQVIREMKCVQVDFKSAFQNTDLQGFDIYLLQGIKAKGLIFWRVDGTLTLKAFCDAVFVGEPEGNDQTDAFNNSTTCTPSWCWSLVLEVPASNSYSYFK